MNADAKQRVKDVLRARVAAELDSLRLSSDGKRSATGVDQASSYTVDDLSRSDEGRDLADLYDDAVARLEAVLARIEQLDVRPTTTVASGAIVTFGGDRYVVGVVADAFECDGVVYEGISADSPVYAAITGLGAGDSFSFGGQEHRIDVVA